MKQQSLHVGITNIDLVNGKSHVYEYTIPYSEIPTIYDEIERYICVLNPSETTIISNLSTSHLKSVVNYLNISSVQINYINLDDTVVILIHEKHYNVRRKNTREKYSCCAIL